MIPCFIFALGENKPERSQKEVDEYFRKINLKEEELGLRCLECKSTGVIEASAKLHGAPYFCFNCTHKQAWEVEQV